MNHETNRFPCVKCGKKYETQHLADYCDCADPKPKYKDGDILKGVKRYNRIETEHYTVTIISHNLSSIIGGITYRLSIYFELKLLWIVIWKKEYEVPCTSEEKMGIHYGIKNGPI